MVLQPLKPTAADWAAVPHGGILRALYARKVRKEGDCCHLRVGARAETLLVATCAPLQASTFERLQAAGLVDIDQRSLMIRMDFADFADYWQPFASGEGALGAYVATLDDSRRDRLEHHLREAYLTGRPDGERSFVAVALSCRGVVPSA